MSTVMTALENAVILRMLSSDRLSSQVIMQDRSGVLSVSERDFTEVGFFTYFVANDAAKMFPDGVSLRWTTSGRLNSYAEVCFVVYVNDGMVRMVEGAIYGGQLGPKDVRAIEVFDE